ncbi:BamA/TamA family outer membrane protein [Hymenobacter guriensis]|uniref:BamA/TamA family outer membrane protein n=1 Tax=Hymenobacter guriensis TaxID=2793065 RepID=A0ABS0L2C1_9BACT|nr:BamA/TamA family outer membrane protein [Hymenobacter guriensis]MBG8554255.1 BamA/TamA family outer membrane protein [Hymenobacter guriensis]
MLVLRAGATLLLTLLALATHAQSSTDSVATRKPSKKTRRVKVAALPIVFSQPETGVAYGAAVLPVWRFGSDTTTRSSNARLLAYRTQRKQSSASFTHAIFTPGERYFISGEAQYFNLPIYYYGVGNDTRKSEKSDISYRLFILNQRVLKRLRPGLFVGGLYRLTNLHRLQIDDPLTDDGTRPNWLLERSERERQNTLTSGLGPALIYDTRDNILSAHHGNFLDASALLVGKALGSDFTFSRLQVDARRYQVLGSKETERTVLAGQVLGTFHGGTVPFRELAQLGGERMMRGIYEGRFRDRQLLAAQVELRQQLFWRLRGVVFGSAGQVQPQVTDFRPGQFNLAGGAGLRIDVNRQDRLSIRIDYGVGSGQSSGLYFAFNEAF